MRENSPSSRDGQSNGTAGQSLPDAGRRLVKGAGDAAADARLQFVVLFTNLRYQAVETTVDDRQAPECVGHPSSGLESVIQNLGTAEFPGHSGKRGLPDAVVESVRAADARSNDDGGADGCEAVLHPTALLVLM